MLPPLSIRYFRTVFAFTSLSLVPLTWAEEATEKNSIGMSLRLLEGGRFTRGTDARERGLSRDFPLSVSAQFFGNPEYPAHVTWITRPFWIGRKEVTVGQWKTFVEATGYRTTAEKNGKGIVGWSPTPEDAPLYQSHDFERQPEFTWRNPGFPQTDSHPVVGISWQDAQAFLAWLSQKEGAVYRLPTEAEWEYACRGATDTWFSFGDQPRNAIHRHANIANVELERHRKHSAERQWLLDWEKAPTDGHVFTAPVGSFEPNAFSLHDMHGNVWEWCDDLWLDTFYKRYDAPKRGLPREMAIDPVNESEPQTEANRFRTIRGGSWYNGPIICRSSNRTPWDEPDASCYLGFRVVREADPAISTTAREALEKEQTAVALVKKAGGIFSASRGLSLVVSLEGETLSSEALAALSAIPGIDSLSLGQKEPATLTHADLEAIGAIRSLRSLDFRTGFDLDDANLASLASLPRLETLRFSRSTSLGDDKLSELKELTTLRSFRAYGLAGGLTDAGVSHLAGNRTLEELELFEVDVSGAFLPQFSECPLRALSISRLAGSEMAFTDEGARHLAHFPGLVSLRLIEQGQLSDLTLSVIGELSDLETLELRGCQGFSTSGFRPLGHLVRLKTLDLRGTEAGDEALVHLSAIPRLQRLSIGSENLSDRGFASLASMISLEDLSIETCMATDAGLPHLGRINRLKRLDLGGANFTGTGLGPIARLPSLSDLKLRSPALTDVVFEQFARSRSLRKLRLVERGWQPPAALTDEGLLAIAPATWLTELWLPRNDTGLTEEGIAVLKRQMPKTSVIPYTVEWDRPPPSP